MSDIERELRALADTVVVPDPPDVRAAVRARIATPAGPARSTRPRWIAAIVVALLATGLVASPQARAAVGDVLRFAGVDVQWGSDADDAPRVPESPLPGAEPASLVAAREQAAFEIGVPSLLGPPDRVVVADRARVVSLLYDGPDGRIRLDEFDGRLEPIFYKTVDHSAMRTPVNGNDGWWLSGPHSVRYVDRDGVVHNETARLAASTLIWVSGAVSYRLEADVERDEAVRIAESIEP
jgi:hypothetical protein